MGSAPSLNTGWRVPMQTQISPMLAVSEPSAAIDFYARAFGAVERWRIGNPPAVAGLAIDGAEFFLAHQNPPGTLSPEVAGHTTVRIELFVDDPRAVLERAVDAGARTGTPIEHPLASSRRFGRAYANAPGWRNRSVGACMANREVPARLTVVDGRRLGRP